MKAATKESLKQYGGEVAGLVKLAIKSKPIKFAIAGSVVGLGIGSGIGVPVIGLYIGAGVGAYQGITAS